MAMTPPVAASRASRRNKLRFNSAAASVFMVAVVLLISSFEWLLLDPLPWYGRLAVILFCWILPCWLLLGKISKALNK